MKIRIKGNSLRVRLSKPEVKQFCDTGVVEETTAIGDPMFRYRLERSAHFTEMDAAFAGGCITMYVPATLMEGWYENEVVGFSHHKPLNAEGSLFLLLEKDFKCIDSEVMEDQTDNYENPLHTCN